MGETSGIEWTDATFNPWIGCTKVSPACDNCYAEDYARRYKIVEWGNNPRKRTSIQNWNNPRRWQRKADEFEQEHGRPRFVFCASLADVFDNQVPDDWRSDLFDLIRECDRLVWLLLTKRPQNIAKMLPADWGDGWRHVWLGTTVEDQKRANMNIPPLLAVPAARRFLSCEPIVGPIDVGTAIRCAGCPECGSKSWGCGASTKLHWIITGGETGAEARPADPEWYRHLRNQSVAQGVPFFFKQWGEFEASGARVGKKKAGRIMDGQIWDERPNPK